MLLSSDRICYLAPVSVKDQINAQATYQQKLKATGKDRFYTSHLIAYEDGTDRVFHNVGI
jgi:hypothetical protein